MNTLFQKFNFNFREFLSHVNWNVQIFEQDSNHKIQRNCIVKLWLKTCLHPFFTVTINQPDAFVFELNKHRRNTNRCPVMVERHVVALLAKHDMLAGSWN